VISVCSGSQVIFGYYSGSPYRALLDVYPEFKWEAFRFKALPKLCWKDECVLFAFVKTIEEVRLVYAINFWFGFK
jgi:hypothetical protein